MLYIADFMREFHSTLHEVTPEDLKRDLTKHERIIKHTLYMVMGQHEHFKHEDAVKFQEKFHVRIDQMASDFRTWKRAGCKAYAKPKQYVSGRVAGASKKAFDLVLNKYILESGGSLRSGQVDAYQAAPDPSLILDTKADDVLADDAA